VVDYAEHSLNIAKQRKCQSLSIDGFAAIHLYTQGFSIAEHSLYHRLNTNLRSERRSTITPFFPYLRLLGEALTALPRYKGQVWRGVKRNLASAYPEKKEFIWWGLTSCTTDMKQLESEIFCGKTGDRTIFTIADHQGVAIQEFSQFPNEAEILLPPASKFRVKSNADFGSGLHIITLDLVPGKSLIDFQPQPSGTSSQGPSTPGPTSTQVTPTPTTPTPTQGTVTPKPTTTPEGKVSAKPTSPQGTVTPKPTEGKVSAKPQGPMKKVPGNNLTPLICTHSCPDGGPSKLVILHKALQTIQTDGSWCLRCLRKQSDELGLDLNEKELATSASESLLQLATRNSLDKQFGWDLLQTYFVLSANKTFRGW